MSRDYGSYLIRIDGEDYQTLSFRSVALENARILTWLGNHGTIEVYEVGLDGPIFKSYNRRNRDDDYEIS